MPNKSNAFFSPHERKEIETWQRFNAFYFEQFESIASSFGASQIAILFKLIFSDAEMEKRFRMCLANKAEDFFLNITPAEIIYLMLLPFLYFSIKKNMHQMHKYLLNNKIDSTSAIYLEIQREKLKNNALDEMNILRILMVAFFIASLILQACFFYVERRDFRLVNILNDVLFSALILFKIVPNFYRRPKFDGSVEKAMEKEMPIIKRFFPAEFEISYDIIAKEMLSKSYYKLTFSSHGILKGNKVAKIINEVLEEYRLPIIKAEKNIINLGYPEQINKINLKNIAKDISSKIKSADELECMFEQIDAIAKAIQSNFTAIPEKLNDDLSYQVYLHVPKEYQNTLTKETLDAIFAQLNIVVTSYDSIILTGNKKGDESKLLILLDELKSHTKKEININKMAAIPNFDVENENQKIKMNRKEKKSEKILTSKELLLQAIKQEKQEIGSHSSPVEFASGTYNSQNITDIFPINGAGLPLHVFFIKFALKPEHFEKHPGAYEKFLEIAKKGLLANGEKGAQGGKFTWEEQRDIKGKPFVSNFKLKALGTFGNIRVHGEKEKEKTNGNKSSGSKILYVMKGINFKHG